MSGNKVRSGSPVGTAIGTDRPSRSAGATIAVDSGAFGAAGAPTPVVQDIPSAFSMLEDAITTNSEVVNELYRRLGLVLDFNSGDSRPDSIPSQCGASPMINRILSNEAEVRSINNAIIHLLQNLTV